MAGRREDAFGPHGLYLGVGVGKPLRWAVAANGEGEAAIDRPPPNLKADADAPLDEAGPAAPVDSSHGSRAGDKALKDLLALSCNSLVGTKDRFGRYYDECASRGMRHNRALKAVARKEPGVIYAAMRDRAPYEGPPSGAGVEKSPVTT